MKPILHISLMNTPDMDENKKMTDHLSKHLGENVFIMISGGSQHNSVKLITGRSTKLKQSQINKLLNL